MKQFLLKTITLLTVHILFTCFIIVLVIGFAALGTSASLKFICNLMEK